jgi:hypothetical protein
MRLSDTLHQPRSRNGNMFKVKFAFLVAFGALVLGGNARAGVVLQNLNTEDKQTVTNTDTGTTLDTNINFSTSVNPSNLTHLILFGTAGQNIYAKFNLTGIQSDELLQQK